MHANQILDPIFHQVLDPCLNTPEISSTCCTCPVTCYGNKYKYILSGTDAVSRYKVARALRMKQTKDVADMIADNNKVGPLTYPEVFQYDNGSDLKAEVAKMLEKCGVMI